MKQTTCTFGNISQGLMEGAFLYINILRKMQLYPVRKFEHRPCIGIVFAVLFMHKQWKNQKPFIMALEPDLLIHYSRSFPIPLEQDVHSSHAHIDIMCVI